MWLFGGGRLLIIWKGQRRKGGLPGWLYLNQAPDLNLLAMSSENEFCSVSLSCLMNYREADFTLGLLHKSCTWNEETRDKQREKGGGVTLRDHEPCGHRGLLQALSSGCGCFFSRTVILPAEGCAGS